MICPKCIKTIPNKSAYCMYCGELVNQNEVKSGILSSLDDYIREYVSDNEYASMRLKRRTKYYVDFYKSLYNIKYDDEMLNKFFRDWVSTDLSTLEDVNLFDTSIRANIRKQQSYLIKLNSDIIKGDTGAFSFLPACVTNVIFFRLTLLPIELVLKY